MTRQSFGVQVHSSGIAVRNDRHVPTIGVVACPSCGAAVGERCRTAAGVTSSRPHDTRRRLAVRASNERIDLDALKRIRAVGPGARRAVRRKAGATLVALGALVGASHYTVSRWESGHDPAGEAGSRYAVWVLERLP